MQSAIYIATTLQGHLLLKWFLWKPLETQKFDNSSGEFVLNRQSFWMVWLGP